MVNNCKVISIANQKGGVGKTVSCVNCNRFISGYKKAPVVIMTTETL